VAVGKEAFDVECVMCEFSDELRELHIFVRMIWGSLVENFTKIMLMQRRHCEAMETIQILVLL
jgi:hypothetical protein